MTVEHIVEFASTSGWQRVRLSGARPHHSDWAHASVDLRFTNSFWRRQPPTSRTIVKDALVHFPQVLVTSDGLRQLADALIKWEATLWPNSPPYDLGVIDIATGDQSLTFAEGTTTNICQPWQKVLDIAFTINSSTSFEQQLILDTTILDHAVDNLRSFLLERPTADGLQDDLPTTLVSLEWVDTDRCRATLQSESGPLETEFTLARHSAGIGANPEPDIFHNFPGHAADIRAIVSAVVRFCLVAQGETVE